MSNTSRQDLALARLTGSAATAFLVAVCCVFPLYIDRFSNLGLIKFSGVFTLLLLFALLLGACALPGEPVRRNLAGCTAAAAGCWRWRPSCSAPCCPPACRWTRWPPSGGSAATTAA